LIVPEHAELLSLQIGDDKHVTLPGVCKTINVTVAP